MKKILTTIKILIVLILASIIFAPNKVKAITVKDAYNTQNGQTITAGSSIKLGASVLTSNKNVYCVSKSQNTWKNQATFNVSALKKTENTAAAYILSQDKFKNPVVGSYTDERKKEEHNSVSQNAYWRFLGQIDESKSKPPYSDTTAAVNKAAKEMLATAKEFAEYRNGYKSISRKSGTIPAKKLSNGNTVVGPIQLIYKKTDEFGGIKSYSVIGKKDGKTNQTLKSGTDYYLSSDAKGEKQITAIPASGKNFYIVVSTSNKNIEEITSMKVVEKQTSITVKYYDLTRVNYNGQNLRVVSSVTEGGDTNVPISINTKTDTEVKLKFYKEDFADNKLSGAKITIEAGSNVSFNKITKTSVSSGLFGEITFKPVKNTGSFTIKLSETASATGHTKMSGTATLTVNYNKSTGALTSVSIDDAHKAYFDINTGATGVITLKNDATLANVVIAKNVAGAVFKIAITNATELKVHKSYFVDEKPEVQTKDKDYKTSCTGPDSDGNYTLKPNNDKNKIQILNAKTKTTSIQNSAGATYKAIVLKSLKLARGAKYIRVTLNEQSAPTGYKKINGGISVKFDKTSTGFKVDTQNAEGHSTYDTTKITAGEFDISSSVMNFSTTTKTENNKNISIIKKENAGTTNKVKIQLTDLKEDPSKIKLQLTKVSKSNPNTLLPEAKFTAVFKQDGKTLATIDSTPVKGKTGLYEFESVQPKTTKAVTATITEKEAPNGYVKLSKPIVITFTYNSSNNGWTAKLTSNPESAAKSIKATTANKVTTVTGTIENPPADTQIDLQLIKVDKNNKDKKLEGAEFSVKFTQDGKSTTIKTNSSDKNGIAKLSKKFSTTSKTNVTVEITETKAPIKYLKVGTIKLTLEYDTKNNKWKNPVINTNPGDNASNATTTTSGKVATIGLTVEDPTIPQPEIDLTKTDPKGNALKGAEFEATFKQGTTTLTTINKKDENNNGKFKFAGVQPNTTEDITVTLKETKVPEGYVSAGDVVLTLKYDANSNKWTASIKTNPGKCASIKNGNTVELTIKNPEIEKPTPIDLKLIKTNLKGDKLEGAEFKAEFMQDGKVFETSENKVSGKDGVVTFDRVQPETNKAVTVKITETKAPNGYILSKSVELEFTWDIETKSWEAIIKVDPDETVSKVEASAADKVTTITATLINYQDPPIELQVIKTDEEGNKLAGAKFEAVFTQNGDIIGTSKDKVSDENGLVTFDKVSTFSKNEITVTITETEAPEGYALLRSPIVLKLTYNDQNHGWNAEIKENPGNVASNIKTDVTIKVSKVSASVINKEQSPKVPELVLNKTDKSGEHIVAGAKFKVYFNNITYVKLGENVYYLEDIIKENNVIKRGESEFYQKEAEGLTFLVPKVQGYEDRLYIEGLLTDEYGQISIDEIGAIEDRDTIYMYYEEMEAINGYDKLPEKLRLLLRYNNKNNGKWEIFERSYEEYINENIDRYDYFDLGVSQADYDKTINGNYKVDGSQNRLDKEYWTLENSENSINILLKDDYKIDKLEVLKASSLNNEAKVAGAKFDIVLRNVKSVNGKASQDGQTILSGVTTDANGNITLENIVIRNGSEPVRVELTETEAPEGYKKLDGKIVVDLTRNGDEYTINATKDQGISDDEFKAEDVEVNGHQIALNIRDIPVMNLSGQVWLDGQQGIKDAELPNGEKDSNEEKLKDVTVYLFSAEEGIVDYQTTDEKGEYAFNNIPRTEGGYRVIFEYNGVTHQETDTAYNRPHKEGTEFEAINSDASEYTEIRNSFNDKFNKINANGATSVDGTITKPLSYDSNSGKSKLRSSIDGSNPANNNKKDFAITAATEPYTQTQENVDCGLVERYLDLAVGMDIDSATLTINDKTTKYDYAQILDDENYKLDIDLDDLVNGISADKKDVIYNLYLDYSDYNYRISDYTMAEGDKVDVTEASVDNKTDDAKTIIDNKDINKPLRAFVTYKVILKNQSTINSARVNELAYYYDPHYIISSVGTEIDENGIAIDNGSIAFNNDNSLPQMDGKNSARVTGLGGYNLEADDYRQVLYFTFEIQRDENGVLPESIGKDGGIECANIVEILSYSTDEGLIDDDSCPGNITTQYEDDTDRAKGLKVSVTDNGREIKGTVFDDENKNGDNDDAKPVNDVIVQLIEVKKIRVNDTDRYFEYIWQETRSGSDTVKTTKKDGSGYISYRVEGNGTGEYKFTGFIPGNYIIRFIYGDGRTYDISGDNGKNVREYNGQDYQSTIDKDYNQPWYNDSGYGVTSSVARDNEARRLKVMSYSTKIDKAKAEALNAKDQTMLQNTWMCAETSKINVPIDTDDEKTTEDNTEVSFKVIDNSITFDNMNFGLKLRPQTKLELEKHITALKITPSGVGVQPIVDAKADISQILSNTDITTEGVKNGLATLKSTRDERGWWKVETDIEELAQGATLEVEYTYVVKNNSDPDYLSKTLIAAYENPEEKPYEDILLELVGTVRKTMKNGEYSYSDSNKIGTYLGQYYYTGSADGCEKVTSRVDTIEEALNNNLKFTETSGTDFVKNNSENVDKNVYDTDGNFKAKGVKIETVIINTKPTGFLAKDGVDMSKKVSLNTVLSASNTEISYPSYIAEIVLYTNAAGRKDMNATPENLNYVHSEDANKTLNTYKLTRDDGKITYYQNRSGVIYEITPQEDNSGYKPSSLTKIPENAKLLNEADEFWGERIVVSKPTGEDKITGVQITIITISSIAVIGVGIVLIKKFALKK